MKNNRLITLISIAFVIAVASCGKEEGEEIIPTPDEGYWAVTWELNGGAWSSTGDNHATQVRKDGTLAEPTAPTKSDNTFGGWYKEAALTNKISFPYDASTSTGNIKLYAKWTASGGGEAAGYKMFTSIAELKSWLTSQSGTTTFKVGLKGVNLDAGNNWGDLGIAIADSKKWVDLDLLDCTSASMPDGYRERIPRSDQVILYKTYGVFAGCTRIEAIKLPKGVKTIGNYAFFECSSLKAAVLPEGLTSIKSLAFQSCPLSLSFNLPSGLKTIAHGAFTYCNLTAVNVPGSVEELSSSTFYLCTHLASVTLNEGLKIIGNGAFYTCKLIKSIRIPASVTYIDNSAFYACEALAEVVMVATVPPSIDEVPFRQNAANFTIKVPAASVNAYKAAAGWKNYADKIVAGS